MSRLPTPPQRPTLSRLVGLYAGGTLFLLTLIFAITLHQSLHRFLEETLQDKAQALADQLAVLSLDAVVMRDYGVLERNALELTRAHDVDYVRIRRSNGEILGEAGRGEHGRVTASSPIELLGNPLGDVTVVVNTDAVNRVVRQIILVALGSIGLITLILFFIARRILRQRVVEPLRQLALQISPLHAPIRLDDRPDLPEEVAQIGETFGQLREEIDQHIARLEQANQFTRAATERLCREQRLATIGQLAAGLAHSLNTPLGNIVGYAQLSRRQLDDPEQHKRMTVIEKQATVCAGIVRNLLTVAHQPDPVGQAVDLAELSEAIAQLVRPLLRDRGVAEITIAGANPCPAWADPATFEQVLFNLFSNAAQAGAHRLRLALTAGTDEATLHFEDDGPGIPETLHESLFEPFVTTKPAGEGTGLGLYICRSLLESMRGSISLLASRPGHTQFELRLPCRSAGGPSEPEDA